MARGADDDVFHLVWRHFRVAGEQCVDQMREHVVGAGQVEAAPERLRESRSHVVDDDDVSHWFPLCFGSWCGSRSTPIPTHPEPPDGNRNRKPRKAAGVRHETLMGRDYIPPNSAAVRHVGYRELLKKYIRFLELHTGDNFIEEIE